MHKRSPSAEEALARWDLHAEAYAERFGPLGDRAREVWLNAPLFELMGPLNGKRVLDAGCGEGYLCRLMAERGARRVVGVDASDEMLRLARERTANPMLAIEYAHGDLQRLSCFESERFDLAVSNMVIQDVPRHDLAFAEIWRTLKPGGTFVFSILHPCFQPPVWGWVKDRRGKRLHWKVGRYFDEVPVEEELAPGTGIVTFSYHRTLANYFKTLSEAGFVLEGLAEPAPEPRIAEPSPKGGPAVGDVPLFLIFKVRKPEESHPGY